MSELANTSPMKLQLSPSFNIIAIQFYYTLKTVIPSIKQHSFTHFMPAQN
jgi:hypothetical protein